MSHICDEEYEENLSILNDVSLVCYAMWRSVHPTALLGSHFDWERAHEVEKRTVWLHACAAFLELRDINPQELVEQNRRYLESIRNTDPCFADKENRDED